MTYWYIYLLLLMSDPKSEQFCTLIREMHEINLEQAIEDTKEFKDADECF